MFSHDQSLLWNFLTPSLGSHQFHLLSQGVRIQMSTFVQSEVPDNIFVVSILNSENQLVTIDLQFQKTLFALVCEDKNEQHKNPHCGVYMSFVRPHKSRPGHRALALHTDPRFVISCEVIQHQDLFSH